MSRLKFFGLFVICVFIFSFLLISVYSTILFVDKSADEDKNVVGSLGGFTTTDKLLVLLSDVIGLDLAKYKITHEGYGTRYEYGGRVYVENYSVHLVDAKGGLVSVQSMFYNGFPDWLLISVYGASLHYAIQPPNGSIEDLQNVFERYVAFAQKFDIATLDRNLVLDLFNQAPKDLPASELAPVKIYSDDVVFYVSQKSFGFGCIVDDVEIVNKSMGITFTNDSIQLHDVFELYTVCRSGLFSKEELTNFAFNVAEVYGNDLISSVDITSSAVKPILTKDNADVSFVIIPGHLHNNDLNNALLEAGVGTSYSVERDVLTLYPFLTATFY